ncbi:MAG: rhomboid family intramembrane serine protease [Acidobacteria bacterium]|nr:rhomboid family intramembrane serine protease [Acidobacteriota bacterium]
MIPLRDTIPTRTTPFFTHLFLAANIAAFVVQAVSDVRFTEHFAFVPARFFDAAPFGSTPGTEVLTLFTSMFLHGGLMHLAGNMLYLWIFGDNVEEAFGHGRFVVVYLTCGLAATALQTLFDPGSVVPHVGASGAIAGVLGAYLVFFPHGRVLTLVPLFIFFPLVEVPAFLYLVFWFGLQFLSGSAALFSSAQGAGGVAWWAHVGGFVAGVSFAFAWRPRPGSGAVARWRV